MTPLERDSRIRTSALVILTFIAVAAALYFLRPVLVPFVIALFIGSSVLPILTFFEKRLDTSRAVAVMVTLGVSALATFLLWITIWFSMQDLIDNRGRYETAFEHMLDKVAVLLPADAVPANPPEEVAVDPVAIDAADQAEPSKRTSTQRFRDYLSARMRDIVLSLTNTLTEQLASGLIVMIFLFFLLMGGATTHLPRNNLWSEVDRHIRDYFVTKTVISLLTGVAFGVVLWLFGVPLAVVFGLLAFLANYVPNIGPVVSTLLPVPLLLVLVDAGDMSIWKASLALGLGAAVQFVSGNMIETKIMGDQFRIHPIAVMLSLMFWGMLWGLPGAFLAVPITSALKIMFQQSSATQPVADLIEGNLSMLATKQPGAATTAADADGAANTPPASTASV